MHRLGQIRDSSPGSAEYYRNMGRALHDQNRREDAILAMQHAIELCPNDAETHNNLGILLKEKGDLVGATREYREAIRYRPDIAAVYSNLGNVLHERSRGADALVAHRRAVELDPEMPEIYNNFGITLREQGDIETAVAAFDRAIELAAKETSTAAKWNKGLALLALGDLEKGWELYDHGFACGQRRMNRKFAAPRWDGTPAPDKTLMIWREQGVGDEIMFASCYDGVRPLVGHCIIECDKRLIPLFARSFPWATVRAETPKGATPDFNMQIPAGSLPKMFRRDVDGFPTRKSFLKPDPDRSGFHDATVGKPMRVGISWCSDLITSQRVQHYTGLSQWGPILAIPGIHWINVQPGDCSAEIAKAKEVFGVTIHEPQGLNLKDDFDGVAALMVDLNAVVTAMTTVYQLAGALGVHTLMYGSPTEWATLGTKGVPWHPSVRMFPKPLSDPGDDAILSMAQALRELAEACDART